MNDSDSNSILSLIAKAASDPNVDVAKMDKLLDMQERLLTKNSEGAFSVAMNRAQEQMGRISTDASNPQTHSKYVTYGKLDKVLRPIYTGAGFSLSFGTQDCPLPEHVRVICYVSHVGGCTRIYQHDVPCDGKGAKGNDVMTKTHAGGAAIAYGKRYLLSMIFNIAIGEDTDGNPPPATLPRISEKQAADLEALITEAGANKAAFLKYIKVARIEDIAAQAYSNAVAALEQKRKAKK
ncbi:MAG: ERF family protein [Gammaproteobacteria bacterium]